MSDIEITVERIQSWTIVVSAESVEDGLDWVQEMLNIRGEDPVTELCLKLRDPELTTWQTNGHDDLDEDENRARDFVVWQGDSPRGYFSAKGMGWFRSMQEVTMALTPNQIEMLQILEETGEPMSGPDLAALTGAINPQGIHQTAASLSRRGLVLKNKVFRMGHPKVVYSISLAGSHTLKEHLKPRNRIKRST